MLDEPEYYGGAIHPLSEEVRRSIHSITVSASPVVARIDLRRPWVKSEAALRGALAGAKNVVAGSLEIDGPPAGVVGLMLSPIGAAVGAIAAPGRAVDDAVVARQQAQLTSAFARANVSEILSSKLTEHAHSQTRVALTDSNPDARLEFSVMSNGLDGPDYINPPLHAFITLQVKLRRTSDGKELYAHSFNVCSADAHQFDEWAAFSATEQLDDELSEECRKLAARVVDDLFVLVQI